MAVASAADDVQLAAEPLRGLTLVSGAGGNVVLLGTPDGAVLVDSGAAGRARSWRSSSPSSLAGAPPATLFNTHWHLDHTGGNEAFGKTGTTIVAHENTRLWMSTSTTSSGRIATYEPRPPRRLPNETFFSSDPQPPRSTLGGERVEYGHLREAHTDGDIYVHFPERNVIASGGAVGGGAYPILDYITGGWIGGLLDATRS